jgi:hypothetical protein
MICKNWLADSGDFFILSVLDILSYYPPSEKHGFFSFDQFCKSFYPLLICASFNWPYGSEEELGNLQTLTYTQTHGMHNGRSEKFIGASISGELKKLL